MNRCETARRASAGPASYTDRPVPEPKTPPNRLGRRLGIFGGTFDPPHVGHLITAVNVRHALSLDSVLLVVASIPWQKHGSRRITDAQARFEMVRAAVADVEGLEASRIEIDRSGPSFTADTLAALGETDELFTILGHDAASGFTTWERYDEVAKRSTLVVVDRPGHVDPLPDQFDWVRVEVPHVEVSSTDLRARFADGRPLEFLLTPPVIARIRQLNLYGSGGSAGGTSGRIT